MVNSETKFQSNLTGYGISNFTRQENSTNKLQKYGEYNNAVILNDILNSINNIDTATLSSAITLNTTTSTKIADAFPDRRSILISNNSSQDVWIKFQATTVDNDKKGIFLFKRSVYEMPKGMYSGEISAISDSGSPEIFITEY